MVHYLQALWGLPWAHGAQNTICVCVGSTVCSSELFGFGFRVGREGVDMNL